MRNNGENIRKNERRVEYRKRNQLTNRLFLFAIVVILVIFMFFIRDVKSELIEVQSMLQKIETLQYGGIEAVSKEEMDYISSIGTVNVEEPVQRTKEETIQKLEELGQFNPIIENICKNSSLYPENMLMALANNPEMSDFVEGYASGGQTDSGGLTRLEKEQDYPLLLQWDPRWGYQTYGDDSYIGLAGCGPTCLSMVLYYLTKEEALTPDKIADFAMENGYYVSGTGTSWAIMEDIPEMYDIHVTKPRMTESSIKAELDKGNVIICSMGKGEFTLSGHFIVIYEYGEQGFMVNDPNCVARSRKIWKFEELEGQIKNIWSYRIS